MYHPLETPTAVFPRNFIMYINDLTTIAPIYKYVDDGTLFEVCHEGKVTIHIYTIISRYGWNMD